MSDNAAILFTYRRSQTMADGSLRLTIDVEPWDAQEAFALFHEPGASGAIVRITDEAAGRVMQHQAAQPQALYGEQARALRLSAFFRTSDVWRAIGTDEQFLAWIRRQPSAHSGLFAGTHAETGEHLCEAAHVRRIANGAGEAIKPPYSAIPLTSAEHRQQHQHGEESLRPREWWDAKRIEYVQAWCWETLKQQLGYEHWNQVPPPELYAWAERHGVERYLPVEYREG